METFYIHEKDWGSVTLLPSENEKALRETQSGDMPVQGNVIWDDVHLQRHPTESIAHKKILVQDLIDHSDDTLTPMTTVQMGSKDRVESVTDGFALTNNNNITLYGLVDEDGFVSQLHLNLDNAETLDANLVELLLGYGNLYDLILVDWAHEFLIHLKTQKEVEQYLLKMASLYIAE